LTSFSIEDSFLRRISSRGCVREDGTIGADAFTHRPEKKETALSFTYQDGTLKTKAQLDDYHRYNRLPSGDLPGICRLTFYDLTEGICPPLPPRHEPDPADERYGHLHCVTGLPHNEVHKEQLAKLATRNGIVRRFVRAKRTTAS